MADDRLQFIHIPKTAGTTLISVLDAQFAADEICPAQLWRELLTLPQEDLPRYRLFRGHFGGGGIRAFLPEDPTYITMLRDPIRLAVSTYKFIRREPGTRKHRHVAGSQLSFEEFIDDRKTRIAVTDKQVRNLSLELNHTPGRGPVVPIGTPRSEVDQWLKRHRLSRNDDDARFDAAMARLEACKWFGLVERFGDSMALLAYTFGWPPVGRVQKLRVAGGGDELSDDLRERLEERNTQDRALYGHASRVFDERLDAMRRDLDRYRVPSDVDSDDLLDELLDRHYLAGRPAKPVCDRIRLDFDEALPGSGWQRREVAPADGSTFRWTGPNPIATLDLDLDRSVAHRVTVRLVDAVSPEGADSLVLMVDGRSIDTLVIDGSGTCLVVQGEIATRIDDPTGVTRLALDVASMGRVRSSHPLNPDEREVGVAVNWVDVRPASELAAGTLPESPTDPARDLLRQRRRREVRVRRLSHRMAGIPVIGRWLQQQYAGRDR